MYCREKLYVSAHELACVYCSVCTHEQSHSIQSKLSVKTVYYHKCYRTDSTIYTAGKNTLCNLNVHSVYVQAGMFCSSVLTMYLAYTQCLPFPTVYVNPNCMEYTRILLEKHVLIKTGSAPLAVI